jgi:hypothetical protein
MHECLKLGKQALNVKRVIANVLDFNKAAKMFLISEGFIKDNDRYILDLKEY